MSTGTATTESIERIAKEAAAGCGQHYEIYVERFSRAALNWLDTLPANERAAAAAQLRAHPDFFEGPFQGPDLDCD